MIKPSNTPHKYQNRWEKHTFISNYLYSSFSHLQSILINLGELLNNKTIKSTTEVPKWLRKTRFYLELFIFIIYSFTINSKKFSKLLNNKPSKPSQKYKNRWEKYAFISNYFFSSFSHLQSILINLGELLNNKTIKTTTEEPKSLRKTNFFSNYLFT